MQQELDIAIGLRIRKLRIDQNLTLDELAQASGVSRAMISRIERAEASPTAALLARLCEALGLSLSRFFASDEPPQSPMSRKQEQILWRDPETGYLRRSVSPPGTPSRVDIVEVEFPPGARVTFPPQEAGRPMTQHIWLFDGIIEMTVGAAVYLMEPGDCLYMNVGDGVSYHNPSDRPARYAVIFDRGR